MSLSASNGTQPPSIATLGVHCQKQGDYFPYLVPEGPAASWTLIHHSQGLQPPAKDSVTTVTYQSPPNPSSSLGTSDTCRAWRNRLISTRLMAHRKQLPSSWLLARSPHRPTDGFSGTIVPSPVYIPTACHGSLVLITSLGTRLCTSGK